MKTNILKTFLAGACLVALASCDDNSWNDEYLNGFDGEAPITDVQTIEYTLTDNDYANIAGNSTNKALVAGDSIRNAALKAVGTQHYFTELISAREFVPAFLSDPDFTYFTLSAGSAVKLTYNVATNLPEEVYTVPTATQYEVSTEDYQYVWGSEDDYVNSFTPNVTASKNIPQLLSAKYPDATAGAYAIVSYQTSQQEPVFGTPERGEEVAYTHTKAAEIKSGRSYILVVDGNAATTLDGKNYGYLSTTSVTEDGNGLNVEDATLCEFGFVATEGGYYIIDGTGRYVYQAGTYNSFNFSAELPEEGAVWSVEPQSDGTMKITNNSVNKFIQYDTNYNSYGSYADARGVLPVAYEKAMPYTHTLATSIIDGYSYLVVAEGKAATALDGKNYGYFSTTDVTSDGKGINLDDATLCEFKFIATEGGYYIIDGTDRYVYQAGTYNSFNFSAELPEEGAVWSVEPQSDRTMKIINNSVSKFIQYDTNYSSYGSYADARGVLPTVYQKAGVVATAASYQSRAALAGIPTTKENAIYYYDGAEWTVPENFAILNPADYTAMGQAYGNLSKPELYLPTYLSQKFPYAQAEDLKFVVYKYYDGKATSYRCDQYAYNGTEWTINNGVIEETAQFVNNGGTWMYDPNVTITLPYSGSDETSKTYYQACVNWVYENIDKPLGSTSITSAMFYVSKYGNNEYYCGTSAYYGNVDLRPSAARTQYAAGYEGMTDDEVVATMKDRFCHEVMPGALATLHPDATPVDGLDVVYTINFSIYTGSAAEHTVRYKVVGQGQFEFMDCTWYETAE